MARGLLLWAILMVTVVGAVAYLEPSRAWGADAEILARVNGEPVTRGELQRTLANPAMYRLLRKELGVQEPDSKELERLTLQKLISSRLILQEADRRNFTVTEQELDRAVAAMRRRSKGAKRFEMWKKARGTDDKALRESLRTQILMTRVRAALVEGVRLTEEQEYYETHRKELQLLEEVRLRIIAVKNKAAAEEVMAALKNGEDFDRLARERSMGPRAAQVGDKRWATLESLPPPLREAVSTLKIGETNGPLQGGAEYIVVRLDERRPSRTKTMAEARPEIEERLLPAKRQEVFEAWLAEQERKSKIEVFLLSGSVATGTGRHSAISDQLSALETDVSEMGE